MTTDSPPRPLKKPRKQRQVKACLPCRKRKIKCEGPPCRACTLRGQASKCSMERESTSSPPSQFVQPSRRAGLVATTESDPLSNFTASFMAEDDSLLETPESSMRFQKPKNLETSLSVPPPLASSHGTPTNGSFPIGSPPRLQPWSHAKMSTSKASSISSPGKLDELWSGNIYELVGNGSSVVYPLQDFHSQSRTVADMALALPNDILIRRYYQFYLDILLPLYPVIADPEAFEAKLQYFLSNRDEVLENTSSNPHDDTSYDAAWFALLYAVLASGAQCLSTVDREAELNSKVFSSASLACLRNGNFLVSPSLNSLQALLQIGIGLRNDMNPGLAWSLLGLTIRHAQVLGCHQPLEEVGASEQDDTKLRLWWTVIWQDITLALCYGHPSGTLSVKTQTPPILDPDGHYAFKDVINHVCSIILQFLRHQVLSDTPLSFSDVQNLVKKIRIVYEAAQPHLLNVAGCITLRQHIEFYSLRIYTNHATDHILLKESSNNNAAALPEGVFPIVFEKSVEIIEAFLKIRQLSILSSHNWPLLQACVLAARFLLSTTGSPDKGKIECLVRALILSLRSSCGENLSVVNNFSTGLSQTVGELEVLLDAMVV